MATRIFCTGYPGIAIKVVWFVLLFPVFLFSFCYFIPLSYIYTYPIHHGSSKSGWCFWWEGSFCLQSSRPGCIVYYPGITFERYHQMPPPSDCCYYSRQALSWSLVVCWLYLLAGCDNHELLRKVTKWNNRQYYHFSLSHTHTHMLHSDCRYHFGSFSTWSHSQLHG